MLRLGVRGIHILVTLGSSLAIRSSSFAFVSCLVTSFNATTLIWYVRGWEARVRGEFYDYCLKWLISAHRERARVAQELARERLSGGRPGGSSKAREILNPLLFRGKRVSFSYYLNRHLSHEHVGKPLRFLFACVLETFHFPIGGPCKASLRGDGFLLRTKRWEWQIVSVEVGFFFFWLARGRFHRGVRLY